MNLSSFHFSLSLKFEKIKCKSLCRLFFKLIIATIMHTFHAAHAGLYQLENNFIILFKGPARLQGRRKAFPRLIFKRTQCPMGLKYLCATQCKAFARSGLRDRVGGGRSWPMGPRQPVIPRSADVSTLRATDDLRRATSCNSANDASVRKWHNIRMFHDMANDVKSFFSLGFSEWNKKKRQRLYNRK